MKRGEPCGGAGGAGGGLWKEEVCREAGLDGRGEWMVHVRNYVHRHDVPLRSIFGDRRHGTPAAEERFRYQRAFLHVRLTEYLIHWSRDLTDLVSSFIVPLPLEAPAIRLAGFDAFPEEFEFRNVAGLDDLMAGMVRYENGRARFSVYAHLLGNPRATASLVLHSAEEANDLSDLLCRIVPVWAATVNRTKNITWNEIAECREWAKSTTHMPIICSVNDTLRRKPSSFGQNSSLVYEIALNLVTIRQIWCSSKNKHQCRFFIRPEFVVDDIIPTSIA